MIRKKIPYETQEKFIEKNCILCSVLVNIDQQKKAINSFCEV